MHAINSEFRKLFTTRTGFLLSLLTIVVSVGIAVLISLNITRDNGVSDALRTIIGVAAGFSYLFAAILGVIGMTNEYRHQTATPTFLATPRRWMVIAAKLITYLVWGAVLGVVNTVLVLVIAVPLLRHRLYGHVSLSAAGVHDAIWGTIVVTAIFGIIGVGLGALLRNQIAAVVGLIVYLFVVESILQGISAVRGVYPYLPGGATSTLIGGAGVSSDVHLLHRGPAVLLLIGYGLVFAAAGALFTVNRDVT